MSALPLIAEDDYPAFVSMGIQGMPPDYEAWREVHTMEMQHHPGPEQPISPDGFRQWLFQRAGSLHVISLWRHANEIYQAGNAAGVAGQISDAGGGLPLRLSPRE